ncbi:MAG: deoxyribonuclease IV [Candidatus Andersenbacteria bacterium]
MVKLRTTVPSAAAAKRGAVRPRIAAHHVGIGAHVSIAGGYCQALDRAHEAGLDAMQIFTSSPRSKARREIKKEEEESFSKACKTSPVRNTYVHTPYYVNVASPDSRTWHFSKSYILRELELMGRAGITYFVMHLGSHLGEGSTVGVARVQRMLDEVLAESKGSKTIICAENTAGSSNSVGSDLEELGSILKKYGSNPRIGCIIDTCHTFAAGYDLRTPAAVDTTLKKIDKLIGWKRIPMLHFNDSKVDLGGHADRHEHLGKGFIGLDGLRAVATHRLTQGKDLILETSEEGRAQDLAYLRQWLKR